MNGDITEGLGRVSPAKMYQRFPYLRRLAPNWREWCEGLLATQLALPPFERSPVIVAGLLVQLQMDDEARNEA